MEYKYFIILRKTTKILFTPNDFGKSLITLEKSDVNPHIHMILQSNYSRDNIQKKLKKFYFEKRQVSVKHCKDYDKSIHYILKEFNILYQDLFTDDEIKEKIEYVKNWQEEKELSKTNYVRYLIFRYKEEKYEDLADNTDYDKIEYEITLFLLDIIKSDYKGFDQILLNRWRNAIFNTCHSQIFLHKIKRFLPNNPYAAQHELY